MPDPHLGYEGQEGVDKPWRVELVGEEDSRLGGAMGIVRARAREVLATSAGVLGHELAHVRMGHPQTYLKGHGPRGDVGFWQEIDAQVLSVIKSGFDNRNVG
ncbi:hypothetical protein LCGC14_2834130 [marine sediment metagenome]|uniref:Uncharacterized protein n=1 Tax=marine sediment metagenome TaxID=412755 RepID=A0A0F8YDD9_9ZZZZ